jgi:hypothetical protein
MKALSMIEYMRVVKDDKNVHRQQQLDEIMVNSNTQQTQHSKLHMMTTTTVLRSSVDQIVCFKQ